ncbi:hypothetical protein ACFQ49_00905 [Kroppenstedtia eburnea]|uniref:hypothetical protein n=1 Tax=Kroppenstedtia eburnea TaxID=714067 RepID=UPI003631BE34
MLNGVLILPALYLLIGTIVWKRWFEPEFFEMMESGEDPGILELANHLRSLAERYGGNLIYLALAGVAIFSWPIYVYQELGCRFRKSREKSGD